MGRREGGWNCEWAKTGYVQIGNWQCIAEGGMERMEMERIENGDGQRRGWRMEKLEEERMGTLHKAFQNGSAKHPELCRLAYG